MTLWRDLDLLSCIFNVHAKWIALKFQIKVVMSALTIGNLKPEHQDMILHKKVAFNSKTCSSIFARS